MSYKHWYDPDFFIQTFDKEGPNSLGTVFPLGTARLLNLVGSKDVGYDLLFTFIDKNYQSWNTLSLDEIMTTVMSFSAKQKLLNVELIFALWDKNSQIFSACNVGLPPVQIRTKQGKCIELTQVNSKDLVEKKVLIDTISTQNVDLIFASDSWMAYRIFKNEYSNISFKKDLLMSLKYFGIPEYFKALNQFVLFGSQTDTDIKIAHTKSLPAKLNAISAYETEFDHILSRFFDDSSRNSSAAIVFNELIMNALEYGILEIDPEAKQIAMQEEDYFRWIEKKEKSVNKVIDISVEIYRSSTLRVTIDDHGKGFDYTLIDQYITDEFDYHGRGIGMIAHMIDGLFYTNKGSQVVFFLRYDTPVWHEYSKECQLFFKTIKLLIVGLKDFSEIEEKLHNKLFKIYYAKTKEQALQIVREEQPSFIYIDLDALQESLLLSKEIKSILGDVPIILSALIYEKEAFIAAVEQNIDQVLPPFETPHSLNEAILQTLQHRFYKEGEDCFLNDTEKEDIRAQNHYFQEQQSKAFEKQKLVIHDDSDEFLWVQKKLLYRPMEIVSGDIYSLFRINDDCFISYIIDSMGKGIAASVTAILSAAFINRAVILSRDYDDFNLDRVVKDFIGFLTPNLLDGEVLSCSFVYVNKKTHELKHVSFGMYPILLKDTHKKTFQIIKSPHPPLMNFELPYKVESVRLPIKFELLIYSDGLCEMEGFTIGQLITLFTMSKDYDDFNHSLEKVLNAQEQIDDITMIFVSS